MSTKTASVLPDGRTSIADWPVGYLVGADELNKDGRAASNPRTRRSDERIFCLAQSTYGFANVTLLDGWYEPEVAAWRWTKQIFSVEFPGAQSEAEDKTKTFKMEVYIPPESVRAKPLNLAARAGSKELFSADFDQPGRRSITRKLAFHPYRIDFELDGALPPDSGDSRERGIIVSHVSLE